jgi:uncharacterized protein YciW
LASGAGSSSIYEYFEEEEEEAEEDDDDDNNNNRKPQQTLNHRLQQVADYQPGVCLTEGTLIFIPLSVQQKM